MKTIMGFHGLKKSLAALCMFFFMLTVGGCNKMAPLPGMNNNGSLPHMQLNRGIDENAQGMPRADMSLDSQSLIDRLNHKLVSDANGNLMGRKLLQSIESWERWVVCMRKRLAKCLDKQDVEKQDFALKQRNLVENVKQGICCLSNMHYIIAHLDIPRLIELLSSMDQLALIVDDNKAKCIEIMQLPVMEYSAGTCAYRKKRRSEIKRDITMFNKEIEEINTGFECTRNFFVSHFMQFLHSNNLANMRTGSSMRAVNANANTVLFMPYPQFLNNNNLASIRNGQLMVGMDVDKECG